MKSRMTAAWRWMRPWLAAMAAVTLGMISTTSRADGVVAPQGTNSTDVIFRILPDPNTGYPIWTGRTPDEACSTWLNFMSAVPGWRNGSFTPETQGWRFCGATSPAAAGYVDSVEIQVPACPGNSELRYYTPPGGQPPPLPFCVCKSSTAPHALGNSPVANECLPVTDVQQTHQRCPDCETHFGKPIFPLTGAERLTLPTGLRIGREPLVFSYDSMRTPLVSPDIQSRLPGAVFSSPEPTTMGANWLSSLHRRLVSQRDAHTVKITRGDGKVSSFVKNPSASMTAEPGSRDRLQFFGFWRLLDGTRNVVEEYDSDGDDTQARLARLYTLDGHWLRFDYSAAGVDPTRAPGAGYLLAVEDRFGRRLQFSYTGTRLGQVTDAAGQNLDLAYDPQGRLTQVNWPDGTSERFVYEDTTSPWALTGWIDAKGVRYASIGYDSEGRATSTELAGGVARYSVSYDSAPVVKAEETHDTWYNEFKRTWSWQAPQGTRVSLPNGSSAEIASSGVNGYPRTGGQSQAAGSGSGASSRTVVHDAGGNVASELGFNGQKTCYVNDAARNLETVRVEGAQGTADCATVSAANASLPAGAIKTSTQWHPDWSLRTAVAEPGQITTYVYNGQRDPFAGNGFASCTPPNARLGNMGPIVVLCKEVVQATTDADGRLGFGAPLQAGALPTVRTWTYDAYGQVLTATDADTGTTTRAYAASTSDDHTLGDLISITTSMGKVTTFDRHDRYGNVLQSIDPSGVVTVNTYDLRQRLLTRTVGGETITFTYDAVGQPKKVSFDNGTWVGFDYDDAHRQVAAYDNKANRIDYVLDDAGNRTDQHVKDPTGALKRGLARAMDALGRAQQSTGRE